MVVAGESTRVVDVHCSTSWLHACTTAYGPSGAGFWIWSALSEGSTGAALAEPDPLVATGLLLPLHPTSASAATRIAIRMAGT